MNGYGVDRHLLGLKFAAIEAGMDVPSLFMDVGYLRSSHMRLSTSQVGSSFVFTFGSELPPCLKTFLFIS